jgi:hypothetical protein
LGDGGRLLSADVAVIIKGVCVGNSTVRVGAIVGLVEIGMLVGIGVGVPLQAGRNNNKLNPRERNIKKDRCLCVIL